MRAFSPSDSHERSSISIRENDPNQLRRPLIGNPRNSSLLRLGRPAENSRESKTSASLLLSRPKHSSPTANPVFDLAAISSLDMELEEEDKPPASSVAVNDHFWLGPNLPNVNSLSTAILRSSCKLSKDTCFRNELALAKVLKVTQEPLTDRSIKVDIEFRNSLQIPIFVSSLSLICDIYAKSEEGLMEQHLLLDSMTLKNLTWLLVISDSNLSFWLQEEVDDNEV
ncbi:hypothetical protein KFK09_023469 [Dendrobium nobile]|uniref:Uncharacterized protein n=1 Tax=Dendrobium nobile TaxID=94219 RepID=A0A8T3AME8_DENNO|nr:hypothetical protein KFK09_023469 [Dendrobium nobile]